MNIFENISGYQVKDIVYNKYSTLGPRLQMDLQLVWVIEGEMSIQVDANTFELKRDECTLLIPGHKEYFEFAKRHKTSHGWCLVKQPTWTKQLSKLIEQRPLKLPVSSELKKIAALALPYGKQTNAQVIPLRNALIQSMILEYLSHTRLFNDGAVPLHPAVEKAQLFIEKHHTNSIALSDISKHAGITPTHLIRLFKSNLQTTPEKALIKCRLQNSVNLLTESGLSAAEIAYQCGFSNPAHFSRTFKETYQLSPGQWRKRHWDNPK